MENLNKIYNPVGARFGAFLSDKPLWAFMIAYTLIAGAIFGSLYAAMYFLALRWWGAVITVMAIGGIWGFGKMSAAIEKLRVFLFRVRRTACTIGSV